MVSVIMAGKWQSDFLTRVHGACQIVGKARSICRRMGAWASIELHRPH